MAYSKATQEKIANFSAQGFAIIEGNNPSLNKSKKYKGREVVRLCQTNSTTHGYSLYTVWAVK